MARRYWPGQDPVGLKFITGPWGPNPSWSTIVGVAGDMKQFGLDSEVSVDLYFPSLRPGYLIVKTAGDPLSISPAVWRAIAEIDPSLAIPDVRSMNQVLEKSARARRWTMGLLGAFAGIALLLALIGIYGVMSWSVAQRTREIRIRMALETLVFDVSTADPWIYGGVMLLMLVVAVAACYLPARRASRVDPLVALRCE